MRVYLEASLDLGNHRLLRRSLSVLVLAQRDGRDAERLGELLGGVAALPSDAMDLLSDPHLPS